MLQIKIKRKTSFSLGVSAAIKRIGLIAALRGVLYHAQLNTGNCPAFPLDFSQYQQ
ncbi:hypothetical protein [Chromatium okenii]|uniref:hypothetical protein n=1 Tax=Chromatium okenii TaxID=61644 RepID=UPI0019031E91|nr:hypothetical protein [Chromatium okenii]